METAEIVVYLVIAIALGALVIAFIGGWDTGGTYDTIKRIFSPAPDDAYAKIDAEQFPRVVLETWDACGLGTTDLNKTVYVTDERPLNRSFIFAHIKAASLCRSLQSAAEGCGTREDVDFADRAGPVVLQLRCVAATRTLVIS
jgi:hypothetical protein